MLSDTSRRHAKKPMRAAVWALASSLVGTHLHKRRTLLHLRNDPRQLLNSQACKVRAEACFLLLGRYYLGREPSLLTEDSDGGAKL